MTTSKKTVELAINTPNYDQHLLVCEVELTIEELEHAIVHAFCLVRPISGQIETGEYASECTFRDATQSEIAWLFGLAQQQYDPSTSDGFDAIASAWDSCEMVVGRQ
jgi:hypothetical protein